MRKRRKNYNHQSSILEELLWVVFKPSKIVYVAIFVVFVGSIVFRYEFFPVYSKVVNYLYVDKVMSFISKVFDNVLPY